MAELARAIGYTIGLLIMFVPLATILYFAARNIAEAIRAYLDDL